MALVRALAPSLVLCGPCRELDAHTDRLVSLADPENGALLVRDVCAAADCAELQLRGHLCADHMLDFELAWQHHIPVRACHGCRQSVILLHREHRDVWCVLPREQIRNDHVRGVEVRFLDKSRLDTRAALDEAAFQSPVRAAKGKARAKLSSGKKRMRRSARTLQQMCERERLRALEWSLGNIQVNKLFLWKENTRRLEAEKMPPHDANLDAGKSGTATPERPHTASDPFVEPEPLAVFCVVPKCRFFAKSGERCRFHATEPLHKHPLRRTIVNLELPPLVHR